MGISGLIKRHPVSTYFALVLIISWSGILVVVGPRKNGVNKIFIDESYILI